MSGNLCFPRDARYFLLPAGQEVALLMGLCSRDSAWFCFTSTDHKTPTDHQFWDFLHPHRDLGSIWDAAGHSSCSVPVSCSDHAGLCGRSRTSLETEGPSQLLWEQGVGSHPTRDLVLKHPLFLPCPHPGQIPAPGAQPGGTTSQCPCWEQFWWVGGELGVS